MNQVTIELHYYAAADMIANKIKQGCNLPNCSLNGLVKLLMMIVNSWYKVCSWFNVIVCEMNVLHFTECTILMPMLGSSSIVLATQMTYSNLVLGQPIIILTTVLFLILYPILCTFHWQCTKHKVWLILDKWSQQLIAPIKQLPWLQKQWMRSPNNHCDGVF